MGDPDRITVARAIAQWAAWKRNIGSSEVALKNSFIALNAWARTMGITERVISSVNEQHISGFVNAADPDIQGTTREYNLGLIRSLLRFSNDKGWIRGNPAALVRVRYDILTHKQKEVRRRAIFTREEFDKLLAATEENGPCPSLFWNIAITIAYHTGLRISDICRLQWDCFSEKGKMTVWTSKKNRRIQLPLQPRELLDAVASIPAEHPVYCFPVQARSVLNGGRGANGQDFQTLLKTVGITGKTFHDLRATYIANCLAKGMPIRQVSVAVGHAHTSMTERYVNGAA